jgi:hypothetical protein
VHHAAFRWGSENLGKRNASMCDVRTAHTQEATHYLPLLPPRCSFTPPRMAPMAASRGHKCRDGQPWRPGKYKFGPCWYDKPLGPIMARPCLPRSPLETRLEFQGQRARCRSSQHTRRCATIGCRWGYRVFSCPIIAPQRPNHRFRKIRQIVLNPDPSPESRVLTPAMAACTE